MKATALRSSRDSSSDTNLIAALIVALAGLVLAFLLIGQGIPSAEINLIGP
jgi:hypothetical protein